MYSALICFIVRRVVPVLGAMVFSLCAYADFDLEDWHRYQLDQFVVYSNSDEDYVQETLTEFLRLKNLVTQSRQDDLGDSLTPFTVFLFDSRSDFKQLVSNAHTAGFYTEIDLSPVLVMYKASRRASIGTHEVLKHEYMHYLVRALSGQNYPRWYDEGIAEFFSTLEVKRGKLLVGAIPEIRASWLQSGPWSRGGLLPLEDVLDFDVTQSSSDNYIARHYASSWLLTHYLNLGHLNGFPNRIGQMSNYLHLVGKGKTSEQAFAEAFDVTLEQMTDEIKQYAGKRRISVLALQHEEPEFSYKKTTVSPHAMGMKLYDLVIRREETASLADELLKAALASNDPVALAVQANNHIAAQAFGPAQTLIETLVDKNLTENRPDVQRLTARAMLGLMSFQPDQAHRLPVATALLEQANSKAPHPDTYRMLTEIYWNSKQYQAAIDSAIELGNRMPSSAYVNFFVGKYLLKARHYDYAAAYLANAANWAHNASLVEDANRYLKMAQYKLDEQQASQ
ncbi:hypothetical protein [Simiduia agarivorans]|uniref:DUF1570 domain-containing protein n=1 Tax=Simiduia agarivorans (strain DSM 21679 / JCM 13881 / BCRC 17597 / SA1) TaxID=1117647 RepID=K4KXT6_SIMAS|nr:hypothetical protein [Simiduia agarivorans]AFU98727.1 hypothetical protein M5M_07680 [Simiduia agarivorans SA1 = DSM 21679]